MSIDAQYHAPMADEELLGLLLARTCERLINTVFGALEGAGYSGLSGSQALAIRFLSDGALTLGDVARLLGVTQQAASKLARDLEARKLVTRGADPHDARIRPLELTPPGQAAAEAMRAAEREVAAAWREVAGADDLAATRRALLAYLAASEPTPEPSTRRLRFS